MASPLSSNPDPLERFLRDYRSFRIKKNHPLLYQGEIPTMIFYLKKGVVKLYNITSSGEEKIVGYESEGSLLPVEWLFSRSPVALYYCDTFTDCELYRVPKRELINFIESSHQVTKSLLDKSAAMYIGATMHLHALEQSKARNKLLYILQYLVLRFGKKVSKTKYQIELPLTHQDIANLIGTTRETVSSEIGKLTKDGLLKTKDSRYIVDSDKAIRTLGEDDFSELNL